jgi:hypothetical protein
MKRDTLAMKLQDLHHDRSGAGMELGAPDGQMPPPSMKPLGGVAGLVGIRQSQPQGGHVN